MAIKSDKKFLSALAAFCFAAQMFVILPHHHHDAEEAPCFNVAHCIGYEIPHGTEDGEGYCHNHCAPENTAGPDHDCSLRVDVSEVSMTREYGNLLNSIGAFHDLFTPCIVSDTGQSGLIYSLTLTELRRIPPVPRLCVVYLAEAHSARAPSFA